MQFMSKLYQETSRFYQRGASKSFSLVASFFAAAYRKHIPPPPKIRIQLKIVMSASAKVLQMYLVSRMETTGCHGQVGLVRGCLDEIHKGWHDAFDIHNFAM
ncbi:hypothetical protein HID58_054758 [Brassica napus]|uniref:Uncharacterized protein n=1 Tax=Brassica napus TaxID=3708 RepID=A0ABQ8AID9_BRANA|nr:hypothetical protein HID58_054758 [Brassica napus]